MWTTDSNFPARGFRTPPASWRSKYVPPAIPASERKPLSTRVGSEFFNAPLPSDNSPYGRAKHVQLVDKNPNRAVSMFWSAINSGDRVDSALKDMAIVMKQLNRSEEAVEAIKSFRHLCPSSSQEALDNILVDLYKTSGRTEDEIEILQAKLKQIEESSAFLDGKRTKPARCQGKKIEITIEQEYARLLGNLAWAYLLKYDYKSAEEVYRKSLSFEHDKNKQCNLAICLMHMNRMVEAKFLLQVVRDSCNNGEMNESYCRSYERALEVLAEFESHSGENSIVSDQESCNKIPAPFSPFTSCGPEEGSFQNWGQKRGHSTFFGNHKMHATCASPGQRRCYRSSPETENSFFDTWKQGTCSKRAGFGSQWNNQKWGNTSRSSEGFGYQKRACPSPVPVSPGVLLTQPRRGTWSFGNEEQKKAAVQDVHRKLNFGQRTKGESLPKKSSEAADGVITCQASEEEDSVHKPSVGTGAESVKSTGSDERTSGGSEASQELKSQSQTPTGKKYVDFFSGKSKKSWADIVEEEEKEQEQFSR